MAAGAAFCKDDLATVEQSLVLGQVSCASRGIRKMMRVRAGKDEPGQVRSLRFGCLPIDRVLLRCSYFYRRDLLAADERVKMLEPLLTEQSDINIDTIQRPSVPTESEPSLSTCAVRTESGGVKNFASGSEGGT